MFDEIREKILMHSIKSGELREALGGLAKEEREHFIEKLADHFKRTNALLEVYRRVADSLSLDVLLPRMVDLISDFVGSERCSVFLYDERVGELYSRVAEGHGINEIRFDASKGIAGSVFQTGEIVLINDAYSDARFNPEIDKQTGYVTKNILCVPIRDNRQSNIVGVVQVLNKIESDFKQDDVELLKTISSQAASAFANAQLHEEIEKAREEEAELLEVTTALSSELQLLPLLTKIMDSVTHILGCQRSTLFLHDEKTSELWSHVAQGMDSKVIRIPSNLGIAGAVFWSGETINVVDAYSDSRFSPEIDKRTGFRTSTILCVPILNKQEQKIGVIEVLNKYEGGFSRDDERRLQAFASQASIAIENAKQFDEIANIKNYNESILESMSNAVITVNQKNKIVKVNQAALRLLRLEEDSEKIIDRCVDELFIGENSWIVDSLTKVTETGVADVAMDTELKLEDFCEDPEVRERRVEGREAASVNMTVVPLQDAKAQHMGSMIVADDISAEKRIKSTMSRYMSRELTEKLLDDDESSLGGKIQKATALFSDIRSFTSIAENIGPQETVTLLNDIFSIQVDVILAHGGILDKYIGDAIMAVFGAPFPHKDDADNSVLSAIQMIRALHEFNEMRRERRKEPIGLGVGINTDEVLSGNIGSVKRMDYTVIGDGVNLASRLEGVNKVYGSQILISEFTMRELKNSYKLREVDRLRVKGRETPVGIYEVMDYHTEKTYREIDGCLDLFHQGIEAYKKAKWLRAENFFSQILNYNPKDCASELYISRCRHFRETPPRDNWDGIWTMTTK